MAPLLRHLWQERLRLLSPNWDNEGALPISDAAIWTVESFATVPTCHGGIQLEIHQDGYDVEIEIDHAGKIKSCLIAREDRVK